MPAYPCPTPEKLAAFVLGTADLHDPSTIAEHVDECATCGAIVGDLESSADPLVEGLKIGSADDQFVTESEYRRALAEIAAFGRDPSFLPSTNTAGNAAAGIPGDGQIRDYKLLKELGAGGMGRVYQALHTQLEKIVAVKLLPRERTNDRQAISRFKREMKVVGKLDHPQIVRAFDAGVDGETHFLVMEYVDGLDLGTLVERIGPLPIADACEIIRQAALALQHVHEHGLVHRDIKPSNLMLAFGTAKPLSTGNGPGSSTSGIAKPMVKLLDLGLALLHETQPAGGELTGTGDVMGTADYISPEQAESSHSVDIRADLYSLGCTLYKLLTGQPPFSGPEYDSPVKKAVAHVRQQPVAIGVRRPDVPAPLAALVGRLLAKSPDDRFAMPADVAAALEPFTAGSNLTDLANRAQTRGDSPVKNPCSMGSTEIHLRSPGADTDSPRKVVPMIQSAAVRPSLSHSTSAPSSLSATERKRGTRVGILIGAVVLAAIGFWSSTQNNRSPEKSQSDVLSTLGSGSAASNDEKIESLPNGAVASAPVGETDEPKTESTPTAPDQVVLASQKDGAKAASDVPTTDVYPTAVFTFDERGTGIVGYGVKISDFLNASLAAKPELYVVDRADLKKILDEQEINLSGLAKPEERVKVGQLTGAKLLISGSIVELDKTLLLTARITGTENGRLVGVLVKGKTSDDLAELAEKLADQVEATIHKRSGELVVKSVPQKDRIAMLKKSVADKQLPKVWIHVTEGHIGQPTETVAEVELTTVIVRGRSLRVRRTIDPAAETEIALLFKEAGFTLIDPKEGNRKEADVIIEGEAFSEFAGRHQNLTSVKARVEITAVDRQSGERLISERQTEIVVDLAEQIAGKTALQNAAAVIAERMIPKLAREPK